MGCLDATGDGGSGEGQDGFAKGDGGGSWFGSCRTGIALGASCGGGERWAYEERRDRVGWLGVKMNWRGSDGDGGTGLVRPEWVW